MIAATNPCADVKTRRQTEFSVLARKYAALMHIMMVGAA
jgi:hypothetical protein